MITGVTAGRLATAAHQPGRQIITAASSIMVDDQRLRGWVTSTAGTIAQISAPAWVSATAVYGGGTPFPSAVYQSGTGYSGMQCFVVCSLSGSIQSTASIMASAIPTAGCTIGVTWSGVPQATAYRVYRSVTANNFDY